MSNLLEIRNLTKRFPGVIALNQASFCVKEGEIHALVGENGAGKSTLMKVLCGLYPYGSYEGDIVIQGEVQHFTHIQDSEAKGIAIIFQELMLFKDLSIAENIFVNGSCYKNGLVDWNYLNAQAQKLLDYVGLSEKPQTLVGELGVGKQQMVEIMKALSKNARLLILDEPTAALTDRETEHLLDILRDLKKNGVTCIYISHRLNEVLSISDTVTVLRDGATVGSYPTSELDENKIVSMMVGRDMSERFPKAEHPIGEPILEVKNWTIRDYDNPDRTIVNDISFQLRQGEILGIAGLMGSGRTELISSLFGIDIGEASGELFLYGEQLHIHSPIDAIRNSICLLTEDRKKLGLNFAATIQKNISIQNLPLFTNCGIIDENKENELCRQQVQNLRIKCASLDVMVGTLSGGNQQKVVLAKLLMSHPKVLILDEPTRGIDVGAKYEIYSLMNQLLAEGTSIIMVSSELPEVLGMSDRVMVMKDGRVTAIMDNNDLTEESIMKNALEV